MHSSQEPDRLAEERLRNLRRYKAWRTKKSQPDHINKPTDTRTSKERAT